MENSCIIFLIYIYILSFRFNYETGNELTLLSFPCFSVTCGFDYCKKKKIEFYFYFFIPITVVSIFCAFEEGNWKTSYCAYM